MKKLWLRYAALGVLCACAVVLSKPVVVAGADDAKAKELIALDADWSKAATARNLDRLVSFYADDAIAYPPNMPAASGKATIAKVWGEALKMPGYSLSWKTSAASVDGSLGFTAGTYQESTKGADGKTTVGHGKYLCVWRKGADGKWKAIHDMWNADK